MVMQNFVVKKCYYVYICVCVCVCVRGGGGGGLSPAIACEKLIANEFKFDGNFALVSPRFLKSDRYNLKVCTWYDSCAVVACAVIELQVCEIAIEFESIGKLHLWNGPPCLLLTWSCSCGSLKPLELYGHLIWLPVSAATCVLARWYFTPTRGITYQ